jgi:two-component system sensor histidine kinase DesK
VSPWILLIITTPVVVRGWAGWAAIPVIGAGAALVSWLDGDRGATFIYTALGVLLAGVATTSFLRLSETVEELRRTRTELARVAVVEERERFSRDLHDLLGHTLSVIVVKAQAVRRLAGSDPAAAAEHAADIEQVGRQALTDVRQAVDAMRAPTLDDELDGARRALEAAGIRAEVAPFDVRVSAGANETLAWVVREGVTNVLRHSGAGTCRVELTNGNGALRLSVSDDGVGGPAVADGRQGGLDGLRRRVLAAGGQLDVEPGADGFRLVARVPAG